MNIVYAGDIVSFSIGNYEIPIKTGTSCEIIPSLGAYTLENKTYVYPINYGQKVYSVSNIVSAGIKDIEIVLTDTIERLLMIMLTEKLFLPVILTLQGGRTYSGDLALSGGLNINGTEKTTSISLYGEYFCGTTEDTSKIGKLISSLNKDNKINKKIKK